MEITMESIFLILYARFTSCTIVFLNSDFLIFFSLFALVILTAELRYAKSLSFISKNFGFMFSWFGRGVFMLFLGSLALDLGKIGLAAGIVTYIVLFFNTIVLCKNKDVTLALGEKPVDFNVNRESIAKAGYEVGANTAQFLKDNPEYAHKAVDAAASNPEATGKLVGAVTGDPNAAKAAKFAASNPSLAHSAVGYGSAGP
jgi:hypothetical protein